MHNIMICLGAEIYLLSSLYVQYEERIMLVNDVKKRKNRIPGGTMHETIHHLLQRRFIGFS
jgi:hypothetical protein